MQGRVGVVCFDWGGVILGHHRSWAEACASAGIELRAGYEAPELMARRREITGRFQVGGLDPETFLKEIAAATGGRYTPDEVHRVHHAWLTREYPGVGTIIRELHDSGVRTAVLSNTNELHWARHMPGPDGSPADFPTIGLVRYRLASHLMRLAKPGMAIFREAEGLIGARAGEILFFDDVQENVDAARRAGWRAELIDHTRETSPQIRRWLEAHGVVSPARGAC